MARTWEVEMLLAAWEDYDQVLADVTRGDAVRQINGGSSFSWTLAHVTQAVDSWINAKFQGLPRHPLISESRFGFGGDGRADEWDDICAAVVEVRSAASGFLETLEPTDLERIVPYDGSNAVFREHGMQLRLAIVLTAAHHYGHLGEIMTKREWLGYETGNYMDSLVDRFLIRESR